MSLQSLLYCYYFEMENISSKSLLLSCLILTALGGTVQTYNYVMNPQFENPQILISVRKNAIPSWSGSFTLQKKSMTNQVVSLLASSNDFIEQNITLPNNGFYQFDCTIFLKILAGAPMVYEAQFYWNGEVLFYSNVMQIYGKSGLNNLKFAILNRNIVTYKIDDVSIFEIIQTNGTNGTTGNGTTGNGTIENGTIENGTTTNETNNGTTTNETTTNGTTTNETTNETTTNETTTTTNTSISETTKNTKKLKELTAQQIIISISQTTFSILPLMQLRLAYFCLFLQDLRLFPYSHREYSSKISEIFHSLNKLEFNEQTFESIIPQLNWRTSISDYRAFSNEQHLKIDNEDDCVLKNMRFFFIIKISMAIVFILLMKAIFLKFHKIKISVYLRRFYFATCSLLQTLFEGNLSFFAFLCFNQFQILFGFTYIDKMSLMFSIVFFWFGLIYCLCYYLMINYFYEKKCGYFLSCYYRFMPGLICLTLTISCRSVIRGVIFATCHNNYNLECLFHFICQFTIVVFLMLIQNYYRVFLYESKYCLELLRHSCLCILIVFIYLENWLKQNLDESEASFQSRLVCEQCSLLFIYCLIVVVLMGFIVEIFSRKRDSSEIGENDNDEATEISKSKMQTVLISEGQIEQFEQNLLPL